jgi:hypothetical protein
MWVKGSTMALLAALSAGQASAQTAEERGACPGVIPGGGRVLECLAKQMDKLSPACQKVVQTHIK